MTVQDLIDELQKIENKSKTIDTTDFDFYSHEILRIREDECDVTIDIA